MNRHFINKCLVPLCMLLFLESGHVYPQENNVKYPVIKLSGYVKNDMFYDSRQTVSAREGHFLLFPSAILKDQNSLDVNAKSNFNLLAIQSNLSVGITGPETLGAKVSGLIEGDFFGQLNTTINLLRLRHAFIKIQWSKTEILFGQYWHPLFVTSCFPATVSFNTGAPLQPFSRAPQLRITQTIGKLRISGALISQRDYTSNGPEGNSSKYLRDSGIPEMQLFAELNIKGDHELVLGTGAGYKRLTPQLVTCNHFKTSETVRGLSVNGYVKYVSTPLTVKMEGVYLENGSEFLNISGFAVKDTLDPLKGIVDFEPIRTFSAWSDIHSNGEKPQFGIFFGYTENLGTRNEIHGPVYLTCNANIKNLYRIAPRISVKYNNLVTALELEYTSALYGEPDDHCIMINTSRVGNTRALLSAIYRF